MDPKERRKLEINEWLIAARWFYMVAIFLIGIVSNYIIGFFSNKSSFFSISILLLVFLVVNGYFYKFLNDVKREESEHKLKLLSIGQIALEIIIFSIILRLLEDKSIAGMFFYLPIVSAAVIFGVKEAVATALVAAFVVNSSLFYDYFYTITSYFLNKETFDFSAFKNMTFALAETIALSNFYIIIAAISGYVSEIVSKREENLWRQNEKLSTQNKLTQTEKNKLNKTAQALVAQDKELLKTNRLLNKKLKELETSEKSLLRTFRDLQAERKKTLKERNKTVAIIANFVDPIIVIDKDGKIDLFNNAARQIFGFIDDDLGKPVSPKNNYSMENFKKIIKRDYTVKNYKDLKSDNQNEEEVYIKIGHQDLTYKVITTHVTDNLGEHIGTMKIFYNLTKEKMVDKLKSEFISIAAHQLRTPLSAIKWVIKMLLDGDAGKLNEEQQKFLFKGYQSNERIINLVNDMLNVSRIDEGRFGYSFKKDDFLKLLKSQIENLDSLIKAKNIKFTLSHPKKVPLVYMDASKMQLVLQNLLENAVKYTPEFGKIEVNLVVGREFLKVKIKDNGVGIPKEDQGKLFSKFFRATNVLRMETEGSGLGLFIVKNIIKKHGGEITFTSKEGMGTEFVFTIPFKEKK